MTSCFGCAGVERMYGWVNGQAACRRLGGRLHFCVYYTDGGLMGDEGRGLYI